MDVKQFYAAIGGSYDEALGRLMRDRLIEKYVLRFPADPTFEELKAALAANNMDDAFRAAHTLKGVCMNLAFSRLSASAVTLTDYLRPASRDALNPAVMMQYFADVEKDYKEVIGQIAAFSA